MFNIDDDEIIQNTFNDDERMIVYMFYDFVSCDFCERINLNDVIKFVERYKQSIIDSVDKLLKLNK